jgi:CRP-like cAMP-binding protein/phosphoribosyl 1,2-cyclic phosphodiesterase
MDAAITLPRGGIYVRTPLGAVQFGVPPETIKDSLSLGLEVPSIFVCPRQLFDRRRGVNVAEVEFPAYYNYFILKRRVRLVVDDAVVEGRIRAVFQESLFGPATSGPEEEFASSYPRERRPRFQQETESFRRSPDGKRIDVDTLVEFVRFDENSVLELGPGVELEQLKSGARVLRVEGREVARAGVHVELPERTASSRGSQHPFDPPAFGLSVLGASHGFDPAGKTTGFILWIGHRGLLVDPPVDAAAFLREQGVPSKYIEGVIVTHCHADHDSGAFQKLLEEGRIDLYTTPTILGSFLRKYSALSGVSEELLRRTFTFHPVKIGAPITVNGAEIWFHYALHSIPTVGFEVFYGGKSLAFSSDTLYDPARIEQLYQRAVITKERRDAVLAFPWHHTVVLHEAGVPPLHTPVAALAALPADVKERLYLVHIAEKDVPTDQGLKGARVGLENTIRIEVPEPAHADALALLDVFCSVDLFRDFPLSRAKEILHLARRVRHPKGAKIIAQGTAGQQFYIIASGSVSVVQDDQPIKTYQAGDYFGETALLLDQLRNADVIARTDVELVQLDRHGFLYLLRGTDVARRLVRLAHVRAERSFRALQKNSALRSLSSGQKTQLMSYLEAKPVSSGDLLWRAGDPAEEAVLVDDARLALDGAGGAAEPFSLGAFLGEIDALRQGIAHRTTAKAVQDGRVFRIARPDLLRFFQDNPGVLVSFLGTSFVE